MAQEIRLIYCPFPDQPLSRILIDKILRRKLAVCANIIGSVESRYWWQKSVKKECEIIVLFKTSKAKTKELIEELEKKHPYDTPCILSFSPKSVNAAYMKYLSDAFKIK